MNIYIYPILLDKSKIEFLKDIHNGRPSCKQILDFMCYHYKMSSYELLKNRQYKKYFVYLCYKVHNPEYLEGKKPAKSGLCKTIKQLINRKQHGTVKNLCERLKIELEIYRNTREEVLSLERNLHTCWRGGW